MTAEHKETLRLGSIVQEFNEAVATYLETDAHAALRLQAVLEKDPALSAQLTDLAIALMDTAMAMGDTDDEAATALTAACAIAFVNAFAGLIEKAGMEDDIAPLFPAAARTPENAASFAAMNAPHIARLCLK